MDPEEKQQTCGDASGKTSDPMLSLSEVSVEEALAKNDLVGNVTLTVVFLHNLAIGVCMLLEEHLWLISRADQIQSDSQCDAQVPCSQRKEPKHEEDSTFVITWS